VLHFLIDSLPSSTPATDTLYLAGNFNGWNPADNDFRFLRQADGRYYLDCYLPAGISRLEFKVTRGGWERVEKREDGSELPNREHLVSAAGDTLRLQIGAWAGATLPNSSTLSGELEILSDFEFPQLQRRGTVRVYLPAGYRDCNCRYPVLYMHDGQNLFDQATSYSGEWGVDETLLRLEREGRLQGLIVIGIDNGGERRVSEYSPWDFMYRTGFAEGRGEAYLDFIAHTLKPYIDASYRTLPDRSNTALAGSSMGGLISLYGGLRHQELFGRVAAFSPAVTLRFKGPDLQEYITASGRRQPMRIYLDMGTREGAAFDTLEAVNSVRQVAAALRKGGFSAEEVRLDIITGGIHHESAWRERLEPVLLWLWQGGVESAGSSGTATGEE